MEERRKMEREEEEETSSPFNHVLHPPLSAGPVHHTVSPEVEIEKKVALNMGKPPYM